MPDPATVIVAAVVAVIFVAIVVSQIKKLKSGKCSCGGDCTCCGCSCSRKKTAHTDKKLQ